MYDISNIFSIRAFIKLTVYFQVHRRDMSMSDIIPIYTHHKGSTLIFVDESDVCGYHQIRNVNAERLT